MRHPTLAILIAAVALPLPAANIDFQREIRPLLSDNCFQCHGPDSATRMANLRLDRKESLPVVPGKPEASLLYQRISAADPARRMPPAASHKTLTSAQIAKLKLWIEQGAEWKEQWAYKAPVAAAPPATKNIAWPKNPIDKFVLAKLEAKQLEPAAPADRRTLIRRVALDLTGLPPTPAELDFYLKDLTSTAYEHMVDRYLASPHFGEQRARYWLDVARYGDTHGIHIDNYREIWPYRDWVINAWNANMPYDRFATEQLAGDLLPSPTLDQRIATGFIRSGVSTNEAGIIEDEYAEIYAKDRAETVSAAFIGLTTGCATCHDHKFDPITQKDFYSLGAFFRNTTQRVMDDNVPDPAPIVVVPKPEDRETWAKTQTRLTELRSSLKRIETSEAGASACPDYFKDAEVFTLNAKEPIEFPKNKPDRKPEDPPPGLEILKAPKLDSEKPFSVYTSFFFPNAEQTYTVASHNNPKEKGRGWTIEVAARVVVARLTGDGGKSIEIRAAHLQQLQHGSWNTVLFTYDGSRQQPGLTLYLNGKAIPTQGRGNQNTDLPGDIGLEGSLTLGRNLPEGSIKDLRIFSRVLTETEARLLSEDPNHSETCYLLTKNEPYKILAKEQNELNLKANVIARRSPVSLVMEERTHSKPTAWILYRGAYDQRRQQVDANTPSVLPPMTSAMPRNRLGFAEWLFTEDNPLTARVAVNRMWQEIFGTGIVKTAEDFGSQGEPPTHPELLDWLAVDFREHNWDLKRFYKQILMSATYRQSAVVTPAKLEKDPENRLLSRAARYRMDGEMVRDYALAATGLLSPQIGGPSVRPYQPEGVWESVAMDGSNTRYYKQDQGTGLYRRSLYTFWKRSAPPASMEIFNAPTRETCTVRRERTDTPLQALVTMNDVQFVEAARELAGRSMQTTFDLQARLDFITQRLLARTLTPAERQIALKSYSRYQTFYAQHEDQAKKFLNEGEHKPDPALKSSEYAALTMLTSEFLNLDEVLNK
jgi:hypothetical protein